MQFAKKVKIPAGARISLSVDAFTPQRTTEFTVTGTKTLWSVTASQ